MRQDLTPRKAVIAALSCLGLACFAQPIQADPVEGARFTLSQPDGGTVEVRIWGDEFYRVVESLDGYTLVRDPKTDLICYARLSSDGQELISTGVRAGAALTTSIGQPTHLRINPASATAKAAAIRARFEVGRREARIAAGLISDPQAAATTGIRRGVCLLVDFSDQEATVASAEVERFCNLVGYTANGNNGSVHDYFHSVSDGALTYTNHVPTAYYRAAQPKSYYEDKSVSFGTRARDLVLEALQALEASGFDFSTCDANADGIIDAVNCYYAGYRSGGWSEGLWPHSWGVSFSADGVHTVSYQITDMGLYPKLATFCHENGHMVCGWPDLYDYGRHSGGVGRYFLMCAYTSDTNAQEPCAYMKYIAGWSTTTVLTGPGGGLSLPASSTNVFYRISRAGKSNEYFLLENRQKAGRDSGLPDAGLAIWHIDTTGSNENEQMTPEQHYLVTLVQADGRWDLEKNRNLGDSTDLWAAPGYSELSPVTMPDTNWWDASGSRAAIYGISASAATMSFSFGMTGDCNGNGIIDLLDISGGQSPDCNGNTMPDECEIPAGSTAPGGPFFCSSGCAADCDNNGVPDTCQADGDGDGRIGPCDNCPEAYNPNQANADSDAQGDACDGDDDNDGWDDTADNCPSASNPDQADTDADGAGDACDACPGSIPGIPVDASGCPAQVRGDFDRDGDVDQDDFGALQACLRGPQSPIELACTAFQIDGDTDLDFNDVNLFMNCLSGPGIAAKLTCDD